MRRLVLALLLTLPVRRDLGAQLTSRAALLEADRDLSAALFASGPRTALPAALGDNAVLLWPWAAVMRGGVVATRFFASQALFEDSHMSWQPLHVEISTDTTLALLFGVATLDRSASPPFPAIHRIGRYLAAWQQTDGHWKLAALSVVNLIAGGEVLWSDRFGPRDLPQLHVTGPATACVAADSNFAADAATGEVSQAFRKWAASDAVTFAGTGELNIGPDKIGQVFAGNAARWAWSTVAADASVDGSLGWTVGQATVTLAGRGVPSKSKFLTLWRRMPDGAIRFIADGGNPRP